MSSVRLCSRNRNCSAAVSTLIFAFLPGIGGTICRFEATSGLGSCGLASIISSSSICSLFAFDNSLTVFNCGKCDVNFAVVVVVNIGVDVLVATIFDKVDDCTF